MNMTTKSTVCLFVNRSSVYLSNLELVFVNIIENAQIVIGGIKTLRHLEMFEIKYILIKKQ